MAKGTVLITGCGKGLGRSLALEFAAKEYNVIIHDRNKEALDSVESEIKSINGISAYCVIGNINSEDTLQNLEKTARASNLDILVNNVGINLSKKASETSEEEFRNLMEIDYFAQVRLTKKILPLFAKRGGIIININSIAGLTGAYGESAYSAAKHAFKAFSSSLKFEVIKDKIKIIDIFPGAMQTQLSKSRDNFSLLIDPKESARYIVQACEFCQGAQTVYPREIYLGRCNY